MSNSDKKSFWSTLPGVITAIAALITAIGGMLLTFHQIGWMGDKPRLESSKPQSRSTTDAMEQSKKTDLPLFEDKFVNPSLDTKWQIITGDWYIKDGVLNGVSNQKTSFGGPVWAILSLDKQLPSDYTVSFRTKIVEGEVTELMLHLSNNRYVRAYLYAIDQAVMLGDGEFLQKNMPGSIGLDEIMDNLGGGITVAQHGFPIFNNRWYQVKVTAVSNNYSISVGGQEIISYSDRKGLLNTRGTIGFISNGHMHYDDLIITDKTKIN